MRLSLNLRSVSRERTVSGKMLWRSVLNLLLPLSVVCEELNSAAYEPRAIEYPYEETLDITPLPKNHLFTSFQFKLESEETEISPSSHVASYKAFPKSLAPILKTTNTRELHLRFGQGWWDSEHWGQLPNHGETAGGSGVEVWAVIESSDSAHAFKEWLKLVNLLSGLFCASLNFITEENTVFPLRSFLPKDDIPLFDQSNGLFLLRAALPSEPVCTENLTPFVKFLPTRGKEGLASLLDGHRIFESEWHMISIDVETVCDEEHSTCKYSMQQKVDAVVDVQRALRRVSNPIPKPVTGDELVCDSKKPIDAFQCFAINQKTKTKFSLNEIFGRTIKNGSHLGRKQSKVCVHALPHWNVFLVNNGDLFGTGDNCFDLDTGNYNILIKTDNTFEVMPVSRVPVLVSRSMTGYGLDKGGLRTVFQNNLDVEAQIIYLETLPWFMRIYLQSLTITGAEKDEVIKSIYYQPEIDRQRPTHLEFEIVLPPNSTITMAYQFDKSLLLIAEYPPDANHGFSVEPGMVRVFEPLDYQVRTSPDLLTLPTPDFSMPYNVIIFTATVMSLTFGTVFNLLFKRTVPEKDADLVSAELDPKVKIKAKIQNLKQRIRSILHKDTSTNEGKS